MKSKKAKACGSKKSAGMRQIEARSIEAMKRVNERAAGIDIGATEHYVCVPEDAVPDCGSAVRAFAAWTRDLDQLVEWLQRCKVTTVAMESTGVYWLPLAQKLEAAGIDFVLVNARHLKCVPGRKTDVHDCQWLQQLHSYGLLHGSFRPSAQIGVLRALMRHRENLTHSAAQHLQHMQKALDLMNVHLHRAVSDLNGETGLRIIDAILAGQRDPKELVKLRDSQCRKTTPEELEAALEGDWRREHLFALKQATESYRHFLKQQEACDQEVKKVLDVLVASAEESKGDAPPLPSPAFTPTPSSKKRKPKKFYARKNGTGLKTDLTKELQRICGVDLTQITGLHVLGVLIILSEIGLDMSRWRNHRAFSAWLGLCPGNKISGGKVLSSHTVGVVNRVATLLRTVAPSVGASDTWLGSFHRRMRARLGPAAANTATAHKLATLIYHLLKYRENYIDYDRLAYEARVHTNRMKRLKKQAQELGLDLVAKQQAA